MKARETTQRGKRSAAEINTTFYVMKNTVKNKLRMYNAVQRTLQLNTASWNGLAAFENAVSRFTSKVTQLESISVAKVTAAKGAKARRNQLRKLLGDEALLLTDALYSLGMEKGDFELSEKVKYTPSDFGYASQRVFLQMIAIVLEEANKNVADLAPFGIDQSRIDDTILLSLEFSEIVDLPRQTVVSRKVMNAQIDALVSEIDAELNIHLDRLVRSFGKTDPVFVATYKGSRTIIDARSTHRPSGNTNDQIDPSSFLDDAFDSSP